MDIEFFDHGQIGIFGFVLAIVLIGSLFQYLKVRSNNETIRQMVASGQPVDREMLRHLGRESDSGPGGLITGGVITLAAAAALYLFGEQIGQVAGDDEVGPVFRAIALFPGLIGAALVVVGAAGVVFRRRDRSEL